MQYTFENSTNQPVIGLTPAEIASVILYGFGGGPAPGFIQSVREAVKLSEKLPGQSLRVEILDPLEEPEPPQNPARAWAVSRALDSDCTFRDLLNLRKMAETDARADYLFNLQQSTGIQWGYLLNCANSIPPVNPPATSPPPEVRPHFSHEIGLNGQDRHGGPICMKCGLSSDLELSRACLA